MINGRWNEARHGRALHIDEVEEAEDNRAAFAVKDGDYHHLSEKNEDEDFHGLSYPTTPQEYAFNSPDDLLGSSSTVVKDEPFAFETGVKLNDTTDERMSGLFEMGMNINSNHNDVLHHERGSNLSMPGSYSLGVSDTHKEGFQASNLSNKEYFSLGVPVDETDDVEKRLSNLSMAAGQPFILGARTASARDARGSELWKQFPLKQVKRIKPRGSDLFESYISGAVAADESYYFAEFAGTHRWKKEYQRNNRNGGLKNIRCFPNCCPQHCPKGFCGESLVLMMLTNSDYKTFVSYAEFGLAVQNAAGTIKIGQVFSEREVAEKIRTNEDQFKPWWRGECVEKPAPESATGAAQGHRVLSFEFNRHKRGWHYGWVANKYINDSNHCVRAYIFAPIESSTEGTARQLKCVAIVKSPSFVVFTRKSTRVRGVSNASNMALIDAVRKDTTLTCQWEEFLQTPQNDQKLGEHLKLFRLLATFLSLPPESFNPSFAFILDSMGFEQERAPYRSKDFIGLESFSKYLISEVEHMTELMVKTMESKIMLRSGEAHDIASLMNFLEVAKTNLERHLLAFGLTTDKVCFLDTPGTQELSTEDKMEYLHYLESILCDQFGYLVDDWINTEYFRAVEPLIPVISKFQGYWIRSKESLEHLERLYSVMGVPIALRTCLLHMLKSMKFSLCDKTKTLLMQHSPKLFSSGVVRLLFNGKLHRWMLASPFGVRNKFSCISYVFTVDRQTENLVLECFYEEHKMVYRWHLGIVGSLEGTCELYVKVLDDSGVRVHSWALLSECVDVLNLESKRS